MLFFGVEGETAVCGSAWGVFPCSSNSCGTGVVSLGGPRVSRSGWRCYRCLEGGLMHGGPSGMCFECWTNVP